MEKHLFLTGISGCGKTTMIRRILGDKLAFAGGFVTERIRGTEGELLGYDPDYSFQDGIKLAIEWYKENL